MAAINVLLAGAAVSPAPGSSRITQRVNERWTAVCTLPSADGTLLPVVGNEIIFADVTHRLFAGTIDSIELEIPQGKSSVARPLLHRIAATDYSHALSRRLIGVQAWSDTLMGDIVRDICNTYLTDELISYVHVEDSPTVERFEINRGTVLEAFSRLAEICGAKFWIDADRDLHFILIPPAPDAPFDVADPATNLHTLSVRQSRDNYANAITLILGTYLRDEATETLHGDGSARTFSLSYPVYATPVITLNGSAQTVGPRGTTGFDWYWSSSSTEITQDDGGTVLEVTDDLAVTYIGTDTLVLSEEDAAEIGGRAAVENNSGRYELLAEVDTPTTLADAEQLLAGMLAQRAKLTTVVNFSTSTVAEPLAASLAAGQLIHIERTQLLLADDFLITELQIHDMGPNEIGYAVEAQTGAGMESATSFFSRTGGGRLIAGTGAISGVSALVPPATFGIPIGANVVGPSTTCTNHYLVAYGAPSPIAVRANQRDWPAPTTDTVFDVEHTSDHGATWNSISDGGTGWTITASDTDHLVFTTLAAGISFAKGDMLRLKVVSGTASGLEVVVVRT